MANHYFSWTIPIREAEFPVNFVQDGYTLPDSISEAMGRPDAVATSSRNDWLHLMLRRVLEELGGSALRFLVEDPESVFDVSEAAFQPVYASSRVRCQEIFVITQLTFADLARAIEEVEASSRRIAAEMLGDDVDPEVVARSISDAVDLRQDGSSHDDGDTVFYLFRFFKSLRSLLEDAQAKGLGVVHVRYVYLFREHAAA